MLGPLWGPLLRIVMKRLYPHEDESEEVKRTTDGAEKHGG